MKNSNKNENLQKKKTKNLDLLQSKKQRNQK